MIRHLDRRLRALDAELVKVERAPSTANVHQARKAARLLRDAAAALVGARLHRLKAETDHLKRALGAVRDLQLQGVTRASGLGQSLARLRAATKRWRQRRPALDRELTKATSPSAKRVKRALRGRLERLAKRIARLPSVAPPEDAHRLRMRIKRAHTIVGIVDGERRQLLVSLRQAAVVLGELHDFDAGLRAKGKSRRLWVARATRALAKVKGALKAA